MRHAKRQHATGASGGRKFNAAGKVVLAAIVHHNSIDLNKFNNHSSEAANIDKVGEQKLTKNYKSSSSISNSKKQTTGNNNNNTHEDDKSLKSSSRSKFSKLFSKKNKQQQATEQAKTPKTTKTTLIDSTKSNEYLATNEKVKQPPKCNGQNEQLAEDSNHPPSMHQANPNNHHDHHLEQTNHTSSDANHTNNKNLQDDQVIEFKFDLIVDQFQQQQQQKANMWNCATNSFISGAEKVRQGGGGEDREADTMKLKLNDNVNELVESFVLDSNDVCLMSIGAQRVDLNIKYHSQACQQQQQELEGPLEEGEEEFEYLTHLAERTLAYSFHLLEEEFTDQRQQLTNGSLGATNNCKTRQQSPDVELMSVATSESLPASDKARGEASGSTAANNYSIELSATLFLCSSSGIGEPADKQVNGVISQSINIDDTDHSHSSCSEIRQTPPTQQQQQQQHHSKRRKQSEGGFSIIDLLASRSRERSTVAMNDGSSRWNDYDDDDDHEQRQTLNGAATSSSIDCSTVDEALDTIERIRAELRQLQLEGCLQTLKKTLIISLKLKQRINGGVFSNRMCLIDFRPKFYELQPIFESIFNGQALAHLKRQKVHLQTLEASLINGDIIDGFNSSFMSDDESTTKQHHQVASQNKLIQAEWLLYKQLSSALIRTLLIVHVQKLVSPIVQLTTKLSTQQLEMATCFEHKLMGDNLILLEFARSIQRASCVRLKRRKRHLRSHLASSTVSVASNVSATTTTNEILSSPLRLKQEHSPVSRNKLTYGPLSSYGSNTYNRKASLDMNLALARHHHRHHQRVSHLNHNNSSTAQRHPAAYRCQTLQRQSDFTESSSISTSSGSQRTQQIRSARSSRSNTTTHRQQGGGGGGGGDNCCNYNNNLSSLNNLSDSDSVTSANLNSCSSSSYNRLPNSYGEQWRKSRHSDNKDIELKWLSKQSKMMKRNLEPPSPIELSSLKCLTGQRSSANSRCRERSLCNRREMEEEEEEETGVMASRASSVIQIDCHMPNSRRRRASDLSSGLELAASSSSGSSSSHKSTSLMMQIGSVAHADTTNQLEIDKTLVLDDNTDNVSDICSVIAEPPKQLKLEEFLNQLSSIIAPITTNNLDKQMGQPCEPTTTSTTMTSSSKVSSVSGRKSIVRGDEVTNDIMCPNGYDDSDGMMMKPQDIKLDREEYCLADIRQRDKLLSAIRSNGNGLADEDDEDCKSHSSILEHLSSLALESNTKLNNRLQLRSDYQQHHHNMLNFPNDLVQIDQNHEVILQSPNNYPNAYLIGCTTDLELNAHDAEQGKSPTGHLQRLLNSSAQFRKNTPNSRVTVRDPTSIEDQLRALSIGCQATTGSTSPSASSGAFISSNESSCSSSSNSAAAAATSSTSNDKMTTTNFSSKIKPPMVHGPTSITSQRNPYTRSQQLNVKT